MKITLLLLLPVLFAGRLSAQTPRNTAVKSDSLPYYEIPPYPDSFTAENVVARMVDGLGFRFYWATEGLRPEDLAFKPSTEARTSEETIDHILGLSAIVLNAVKNNPTCAAGRRHPRFLFPSNENKPWKTYKPPVSCSNIRVGHWPTST